MPGGGTSPICEPIGKLRVGGQRRAHQGRPGGRMKQQDRRTSWSGRLFVLLRFLRLKARTGIAEGRAGDCITDCGRRKAPVAPYRQRNCDDGHADRHSRSVRGCGLCGDRGSGRLAQADGYRRFCAACHRHRDRRRNAARSGAGGSAGILGAGAGLCRDLCRGRGGHLFHRPYPGIALPAAAVARCARAFRSSAWSGPTGRWWRIPAGSSPS